MFVCAEFWEGHFQCRYPNSLPTPNNKLFKDQCDITKRLHRDNTAFEGQLQFVSDAVMAFAHAFKYSNTLPSTVNELYELTP
jgi:metabotropic X receptor